MSSPSFESWSLSPEKLAHQEPCWSYNFGRRSGRLPRFPQSTDHFPPEALTSGESWLKEVLVKSVSDLKATTTVKNA